MFQRTKTTFTTLDPIINFSSRRFPTKPQRTESGEIFKAWRQPFSTHYLHSYLPTYLHTFTLTYLPTYLRTYIPSYLPTYLRTYLPSYLPTFIPTYLWFIGSLSGFVDRLVVQEQMTCSKWLYLYGKLSLYTPSWRRFYLYEATIFFTGNDSRFFLMIGSMGRIDAIKHWSCNRPIENNG